MSGCRATVADAGADRSRARRPRRRRAASTRSIYVAADRCWRSSFMFPFLWTVSSSLKTPQRDLHLPADAACRPCRSGRTTPRVLRARAVRALGLQQRSSSSCSARSGRSLTASLVAYSFARFRYRGRDLLFLVTLSDADAAGRGDADPAVPALPPARLDRHALPAARAVLVRRRRLQHLPAAPVLPDDPARARRGGADRRRQLLPRSSGAILLPLCKPALATVAIISFIGHWNDFLGAADLPEHAETTSPSRSACATSSNMPEHRAAADAAPADGRLGDDDRALPDRSSSRPSATSCRASSCRASRARRRQPTGGEADGTDSRTIRFTTADDAARRRSGSGGLARRRWPPAASTRADRRAGAGRRRAGRADAGRRPRRADQAGRGAPAAGADDRSRPRPDRRRRRPRRAGRRRRQDTARRSRSGTFPDAALAGDRGRATTQKPHPEVDLKIDEMLYADMDKKQLVLLATGTMQDIVFSGIKWFPYSVFKGAFLPLDDLTKSQGPRPGRLLPGRPGRQQVRGQALRPAVRGQPGNLATSSCTTRTCSTRRASRPRPTSGPRGVRRDGQSS